MNPRILVIAEVFPPRMGGSGRWLWELYRRMPPGTVHVLAGDVPDAAVFDRSHDLPITRLPLGFSNWGVLHQASGRQYFRAIRDGLPVSAAVRPDVIHCAKALPEGLIGWRVARRRGIGFWCYVHGEELTLARTSRELRWLTRLVLARAERIVANSDHTRNLVLGEWRVAPDRVVVLHPGVDTSRFVPAPPSDARRAALGWGGRPVVLTVGALQKRKGQDTMIRALPLIRQRIPSVLYAIAGEGWEREYLVRLAGELGVEDAVQFRGVASEGELVDCYQQCDLFALPNRTVGWDFEGFGIVLLEAQACARAVVTGQSGGTVEAVDAPRTGIALDCTEPDRLAAAVVDLLGDPSRLSAMGTRGRQWAIDRFDWGHAAAAAQASFMKCRDMTDDARLGDRLRGLYRAARARRGGE